MLSLISNKGLVEIQQGQIGKAIIINYFQQIMYHQALSFPYSQPLSCDSRSDTSTETDEHEPHSDQHSPPIPTYIFRVVSSKAKSSLCRNFTQKGFCPYGKKCQFAHGPEQLRINMETNRSYKTKGCHAFTKNGCCCYGFRCNFIHEQPSTPNTTEKWSVIYSNHRETVKLGWIRENSRLLQLLGE